MLSDLAPPLTTSEEDPLTTSEEDPVEKANTLLRGSTNQLLKLKT